MNLVEELEREVAQLREVLTAMQEDDLKKQILFNRVEAERDALWEVIRVQAGNKEAPCPPSAT